MTLLTMLRPRPVLHALNFNEIAMEIAGMLSNLLSQGQAQAHCLSTSFTTCSIGQ